MTYPSTVVYARLQVSRFVIAIIKFCAGCQGQTSKGASLYKNKEKSCRLHINLVIQKGNMTIQQG